MAGAKFAVFSAVPKSREYVHGVCRSVTMVTDEHLEGLCSPIVRGLPVGTLCVACGAGDRLERFHWKDTGERLDQYRARLAGLMPIYERLLYAGLRYGLIVVPLAGAGAVLAFLPYGMAVRGVVAGVAFFVLFMLMLIGGAVVMDAAEKRYVFHRYR